VRPQDHALSGTVNGGLDSFLPGFLAFQGGTRDLSCTPSCDGIETLCAKELYTYTPLSWIPIALAVSKMYVK